MPTVSVPRRSSRSIAGELRLGPNVDSVGGQRGHELSAQHLVEGAKHPIPAQDHGDLAAERTEHAGELDSNIAAARDHHTGRKPLELEEPVGRDSALRPGSGRHDGLAAGRDDHVVGGNARAADHDGARADEAGGALVARNSLGLQPASVDPVQPPHVRVTGALELRPVESLEGDIEPVTRVFLQRVAERRRVPHHLLGYAADVHAGAAQRAMFDDRDARPVARRPHCRSDSPAAAAMARTSKWFSVIPPSVVRVAPRRRRHESCPSEPPSGPDVRNRVGIGPTRHHIAHSMVRGCATNRTIRAGPCRARIRGLSGSTHGLSKFGFRPPASRPDAPGCR